MQQWQDFLSQLEIIDSVCETCSPADLLRFELYHNIILPQEYKEYCQILGTGLLGYGMHIYALTPGLLEYSETTLASLIENLELFPSDDIARDQRLKNLFQSSFVFADDSGAHIALWDLKTYRDADKSYDIYWVDVDLVDDDDRIGRSFFEFVSDFCLGKSSYEFLPEAKRPPSNQPRTFEGFILDESYRL
jgi:hypothetical protein